MGRNSFYELAIFDLMSLFWIFLVGFTLIYSDKCLCGFVI
jgi:hypothetical protein